MTINSPIIWRQLSGLAMALYLTGCVASSDNASSSDSSQTSSDSSVSVSPASSSSAEQTSSTVLSSSFSSMTLSSAASSADVSSEASTCDFEEVQTVFENNQCMACHTTEQAGLIGGDLALDDARLGSQLLGIATTKGGLGCRDQLLIDPDAPENSLLLSLIDPDKHAALAAVGCDRGFMPPFGNPMPDGDAACVQTWVEDVVNTQVAPPPVTESKPFVPNAAGAILSRAKLILHGGPVTDEELEQLGGSEGTLVARDLRALIGQWQSTEEYAIKLQSFLTLALQQTNKPGTLLTEQFNNIRGEAIGKDRLLRNMEEMFPRTARQIVQRNEDFRKVVTTNEWFVTTGLLAALIYTEKPQQTAGRDYTQRSSQEDQFKNFEHLTNADFNDWRKVKFIRSEEAADYANTAAFARSLRNIAGGDNVPLRMPRVGFFSTPAFYDNWATNDDNQFRVTTQQTMITALGKPITADDATPHLTTRGIPQRHADPESACFQCHRHMDPMRQVFAKYQVTRNRSKDTNNNLAPSFSFFGVAENFSTVEEFAQIVANHPEFPGAWVQKLCMWGNSERCDPADPEFQRLSENFSNGFSFNRLVRQFFSSPLFTGANILPSHERFEYKVSMTRGNHYCKAMDARVKALKLANGTTGDLQLCNDRDELGIVAPDVFARGQADFIQSTQVSGFEAKAIDVQCAKAAGSVFAGNDSKIINTTQGRNRALEQLVQYVMGVPESHHRYDDLLNQVTRVFNIAFNSNSCAGDPGDQGQNITCGYGKSQGDALRIAWFSACTSPEIISVGM